MLWPGFTLLSVDINRSDEGMLPFMTSCRQRCRSWIRDVSAMNGNFRELGMYIARGQMSARHWRR